MLRLLSKSAPVYFKSFKSNCSKAGSAGFIFSKYLSSYKCCTCRSRVFKGLEVEVKVYSAFSGIKSSERTMATLPADVKAKLDKVPDSKIDAKGKFKYILIKVYATDSEGKHVDDNSKLVVRGRADCPFHGDILDKFQEETANLEGIDEEILGGGRILREGNKISVFGYSQGYGRADHTLTVEILKRSFPTHDISWSNDGY
ncbi:unnamed protein product [Orchesella dallaii]|uniref:Sex-regulated protein janus-A n=1 Tax=Orchesella dallaii TaxID=48710 RepID=A0ABP1PRI7_9HEXA